jgi:hypothetical protein
VIVDPLASIGIGVGLFGDTIHTSGSRAPLEIAALVALFAGAFVLSRSPLIAHIRSEEPLESLSQPPGGEPYDGVGGDPGQAPATMVRASVSSDRSGGYARPSEESSGMPDAARSCSAGSERDGWRLLP